MIFIDFLKKNMKIWSLVPDVMSLVKIILVMAATNTISERTFSALRRVQFYLGITMSNNHRSHLMTCTVHKEQVKELNLKQVNLLDRGQIISSCTGLEYVT